MENPPPLTLRKKRFKNSTIRTEQKVDGITGKEEETTLEDNTSWIPRLTSEVEKG